MAKTKPIPAAMSIQELLGSPVLMASTESRLLDRVVRVGSGCWEWTGGKSNNGYGRVDFAVRRKHFAAHRLAYLLFCASIPDGMEVCHHCDNRSCVRPDHLFCGTRSDNMRDCGAKGRHWMQRDNSKSHLHRLTPEQRIKRGEKVGNSKTTAETVLRIREMSARGMSSAEIAAVVLLDASHIRRIIRRKYWSHI